MRRKLKIIGEDRTALRTFLADADVDLGCRPSVYREGGRVAVFVVADDEEIERLSTRQSGAVTIEFREPVPPPETRRAMVASGNRFVTGELPRGLGEKF